MPKKVQAKLIAPKMSCAMYESLSPTPWKLDALG
jgi:hypothetical protein